MATTSHRSSPGTPPTTGRGGRLPEEFDRTHDETWTAFDAWCQEQGTPPLPKRDFMHTSPHANIYVYPRELDYADARPLDATWHRIDSSVRETDEQYAVPPELAQETAQRPEDSGLIYLSLGSLGGADISLMQRLIDILGTTRHRVIVSMGPRADELRLAGNMTGAATLPQTTLMPQVDLVITHGGNNTTTEAMHFGKPMVLLPLFWDQYDNAQRVHELGFGVRLATYAFADGELTGAVDRLLADTVLRERMAAIGADIRARDGLRRARRSSSGSAWTTELPVVEERVRRQSRNHLLLLDGTHAIRVVATEAGHRAGPVTRSATAGYEPWPGDGAGLAVLHRLRNRMAAEEGSGSPGSGGRPWTMSPSAPWASTRRIGRGSSEGGSWSSG